jgi:hypothetical protein
MIQNLIKATQIKIKASKSTLEYSSLLLSEFGSFELFLLKLFNWMISFHENSADFIALLKEFISFEGLL